MKKFICVVFVFLLALVVLAGCNKTANESHEPAAPLVEPTADPTVDPTAVPTAEPTAEPTLMPPAEPTTIPAVEPTAMPTIAPTATPIVESAPVLNDNTDAVSHDMKSVYSQQINRYYTALSQQWGEAAYYENQMCPMVAYYYEGEPLNNVGFAFVDLDGDGIEELVIGAIYNAEQYPVVFEIWTLINNEPVILAQSGFRNRYFLQYAPEDNLWTVANEGENGAANHAVYYLQLTNGEFKVIQGVVFDAMANEQAPWFMAYDLDWDVSNDTPIDEQLANNVMAAERNIYTTAEYIPYSVYN